MDKGGDHPFFIEMVACGENEKIDANQLAVGALGYQTLDRRDGFGIDRLPEQRKEALCFGRQGLAHTHSLLASRPEP